MTTETAVKISNNEVRDEDLPEFREIKFENINQLELDHPGANDREYRQRRDKIAGLAADFRETHSITDVEYTAEEQEVWQIVATKLEEIQAQRASEFYLDAKRKLGITTTKNSAAFGNEQTSQRTVELAARAD